MIGVESVHDLIVTAVNVALGVAVTIVAYTLGRWAVESL